MTFTVWFYSPGSLVPESVGTDLTAEDAESMTRHPSLSGGSTVVLPGWVDVDDVTPDGPIVARTLVAVR